MEGNRALRSFWQENMKHVNFEQRTGKLDKVVIDTASVKCQNEGIKLQVYLSAAVHLANTKGIEWVKQELAKAEIEA